MCVYIGSATHLVVVVVKPDDPPLLLLGTRALSDHVHLLLRDRHRARLGGS